MHIYKFVNKYFIFVSWEYLAFWEIVNRVIVQLISGMPYKMKRNCNLILSLRAIVINLFASVNYNKRI